MAAMALIFCFTHLLIIIIKLLTYCVHRRVIHIYWVKLFASYLKL